MEDDKSSCDFFNLILSKYNIVTIWAKDGELAVKLCNENPSIDLVLMNINLPLMSGYEATMQIKKVHPNLPIIAQTAYAIAGDKEKILGAECYDYISKPIRKEELIDKVQKLIGLC